MEDILDYKNTSQKENHNFKPWVTTTQGLKL